MLFWSYSAIWSRAHCFDKYNKQNAHARFQEWKSWKNNTETNRACLVNVITSLTISSAQILMIYNTLTTSLST